MPGVAASVPAQSTLRIASALQALAADFWVELEFILGLQRKWIKGQGSMRVSSKVLRARGPLGRQWRRARALRRRSSLDRARARHCVSGLFCVRDDPAAIAGCQLRRFV